MRTDELTGHWHEVQDQFKQRWSKLSDEELVNINGNLEVLKGKLAKHYGMTKRQAEQEIERFSRTLH